MLTENLQTDAPSASIDASAIQLAWAQQIPALVRGSGAGIAPTTIDLLPLDPAFWPIKASRAWRLEDSRPLTPALKPAPPTPTALCRVVRQNVEANGCPRGILPRL
ncbi:hypothetical protein J3E68DRAFT_346410 [Trichoderma sp. SZMC 28012]